MVSCVTFNAKIHWIIKNYFYISIFSSPAADEERKVRIIEEDVAVKQKMCEEDLRNAEPMLVAAKKALNTLNKVGPKFFIVLAMKIHTFSS